MHGTVVLCRKGGILVYDLAPTVDESDLLPVPLYDANINFHYLFCGTLMDAL